MMARFNYILVSLGISALLLGCSSPSIAENPTPSPSPQPQLEERGQVLPITAEAEIGGQRIQLEVAQTPQQQEIGLMFRTELPENRGMLFVFSPPHPVQFWMRNTLIPLDMVFMLDGEVKAIATQVPACTTPTCPTYGPDVDVNQVIELPGGRAETLGLEVGDRITIRMVTP